MIQPLPWPGAAFTIESDGDQREQANREVVSAALGVSAEWATVHQVHGNRVVEVEGPGPVGMEADALFTRVPGLVVAVVTADCVAVVVGGTAGVGVAHAGWRGIAAGVVGGMVKAMRSVGLNLDWAAVGPFIGPCCFEVGPQVARRFLPQVTLSRQGRPSVDLGGAVAEQLGDLPIWWSQRCTLHQPGSFSHRRDGTPRRMAALGWIAQ